MVSMIVKILGSVFVTIISSITLGVPKKLVNKVGVIGFVSYSVFIILSQIMSPIVATLIACMVVSLLGQLFARKYQAPVTIFYIPAFFPFVPGSLIYQGALLFIQGEGGSGAYFTRALMTAGAVALGVFIVDSCFEMVTHNKNNKMSQE